jgi:hypothetical protein
MLERGIAFSYVEDAIGTAQLSHDHKAALRLLASSLRDPRKRRDARVTLGFDRAAAGEVGDGI